MDSEEFFTFGVSLLNSDSSEVQLRTAASRIYYSGYHAVLQMVDQYCSDLSAAEKVGKGVHAVLIERLDGKSKDVQFDRALKRLSAALKAAKDLRSQADYELQRSFNYKSAKEIHAYCTNIRTSIIQIMGPQAASATPDSQPSTPP